MRSGSAPARPPAFILATPAAGAGGHATLLGLWVLAMPLASGLRGFDLAAGRAALLACDLALFVLFALALRRQPWYPVALLLLFGLLIGAAHVLLAAHPDAATLYQGLRKSLLWLFAIPVGASLGPAQATRVLRAIGASCALLALYGVKQALAPTGFDARLLAAQTGSVYANQIGGTLRATSLLSSGFHLGMAAVLLLALALSARGAPAWARLALIGLAAAGVVVSHTRTFLLVGPVLVVLQLLAARPGRWLAAAVSLALLWLAALVLLQTDPAAWLAEQLMADTRFTNRAQSYRLFAEHMAQNPAGWLTGFGLGSAGSTLAAAFAAAGAPWLEPHNILVKYLHEFGLPFTLALVLLLAALLARARARPGLSYAPRLALLALVILALSGLSITSVEAWPVNLYIGLILGIFAAPAPAATMPEPADAAH